jgi:hypothetical protein
MTTWRADGRARCPVCNYRQGVALYAGRCRACSNVDTTAYACPHCVSMPGPKGSCCVCRGTRRVELAQLLGAAANLWSRRGCACETCERIRDMEDRIEPRQVPRPVGHAPRFFSSYGTLAS